MPHARTVTLPPERHEQLRTLADALGCPIADAVGHLIDAAARSGVIPRALPGLEVRRTDDGRVEINLGATRRLLPPDAAQRYAKHVLGAARLLPPDAARRYAETVGKLNLRGLLPDSGLGAVKRGAGVKLIDESGSERVVAPSVAGEFAQQVLEAAK